MAAAAAVESASPDAAATSPTTSLEGRLLPAYLNAAPAPSASPPSPSPSSSPPLLLRLMEQRFELGNGSNDDSGTTTTTTPPGTTTTTITVITPHDVDAIFDALQARGAADGDPYWARVWPSAVALAECLLARPELVRGKRVADVGAGLGVAGLAAALAGAREVALLDREPLALECARLSAEATALAAAAAATKSGAARGGGGGPDAQREPPPFVVERRRPEQAAGGGMNNDGGDDSAPAVVDATGLRALASVREVLGYGSDDDDQVATGAPAAPAASAAPAAPHPPTTTTVVRAVPFNWHERPLPASLRGRFDVVLACDVLYEQDAVAPLAEVLPLLLSASGDGRVLLADPPARTAANRERFLELLTGAAKRNKAGSRRFAVDEAALRQCSPRQLDRELQGGQAADRPVPVQLLHLREVDGNDTVGLLKL